MRVGTRERWMEGEEKQKKERENGDRLTKKRCVLKKNEE